MRKFFCGIAILILFLLTAPWMIGMWFQHQYDALIDSYNAEGNVHITLSDYHRGWWTSDAVIQVEVLHPELKKIFHLLTASFSSPAEKFILDQHIQHGPLFYGLNFPAFFGWVCIKSTVRNQPILLSNDFISLLGNYVEHLHLYPFQINDPDRGTLFQFDNGMDWNISMRPGKKITGDAEIKNILFTDDDESISIPRFHLEFDQRKTTNHLWMGSLNILIPELQLTEADGAEFSFSHIYFRNKNEISADNLNSMVSLNIKKMEWNKEVFGPFQSEFRATKLNKLGVEDLIDAYQKIMSEGELYESQLQKKIMLLLPNIINPGSRLEIKKFSLTTNHGNLQANGEIFWPADNKYLPDTLEELLQAGNAKGLLRISIPLMHKWIRLASDSPYFYSLTDEERHQLLSLEKNVNDAMQRNTLLISSFVDHGWLAENAAVYLLTLQKDNVSMERYTSELKYLFLGKEIPLYFSYVLSLQYNDIQNAMNELTKQLDTYQKAIEGQMRSQLNDWVRKGYFIQDKNDYVASLKREQGVIKVNGVLVQ